MSNAAQQTSERWQFWIDRGGTFTDVIARQPDGRLRTMKLLSEDPGRYEDAAVEGIRRFLQVPDGAALPGERIETVKMGTTVATNALLERKGARTAFVTTAGFGDMLSIGSQNRPDLFALDIVKPQPLYSTVLEVAERVDAQGRILQAPDPKAIREGLDRLAADGIEALAICFLHGYRQPAHERLTADIAQSIGFEQISVSHTVSPLMRCIARGHTSVVDAYLSPILRRYVARVAGALREPGDSGADAGRAGDGNGDGDGPQLYFMQSHGGLARADDFQGKDAILSGPAGGVVGLAAVARLAGLEEAVGFDMGGTSTDVSYFSGAYDRRYNSEVAGVKLSVPMLRIETVAAGGGSTISFDGARLRVGPQSAGADPGPACYRKGGPLTVTDANVLVGKLDPDFFPRVFGPMGDKPLDASASRAGFDALRTAMGDGRSLEDLADGCLAIATETMAQAVKTVSLAQGHDVTRAGLVCFGGAAAQHACKVAEALAMERIVVHPLSGLLSAYGIGLAEIRAIEDQGVELPLSPEAEPQLTEVASRLSNRARAQVLAQGVDSDKIVCVPRTHIRYEGTDTALTVEAPTLADLPAAFEAAHKRRFGFTMPDKALVIEAVSVEAVGTQTSPDEPVLPLRPRPTAEIPVAKQTHFFSAGTWHDAPVVVREALRPGDRLPGPAIIAEPHATIVVEPGWQAHVSERDHVILERHGPGYKGTGPTADYDPVTVEVFNSLFMAAAEQMGVTLENTATSITIKERLDFSCALFDAQGNLIANAPHIPVHLGSMGDSVRAVITAFGSAMEPGDIFVLNDPYRGGTHLPDITVVAPVFAPEDGAHGPMAFTAARGHHADVGGLSPGSMPAFSTRIDQEGCLISPARLVRAGHFEEGWLRAQLGGGPYPARSPDQNVADLRAQIAACERGGEEIRRLAAHYGPGVVTAQMEHVQSNAQAAVRRAILGLEGGHFTYAMDAGRRIQVAIRLLSEQDKLLEIDFTGSSGADAGNFNAPTAVVRAAVLYALRCLVADAIPLNDGCLRPVRILVPEGGLLAPQEPSAVVAGNVETSQAVTNALFAALGILAPAQGTMNNLTLGNEHHQYYETLCGGAGASAQADGADAVHTHMTNSRLTDPEVLEWRLPVRLERFAIRHNSGGIGAQRGGDGLSRHIRVLEAMDMAILSGHRTVPNGGLHGGAPGALGHNRVLRTDGRVETLEGCDTTRLEAGDVIMIETPGGGGFGRLEAG